MKSLRLMKKYVEKVQRGVLSYISDSSRSNYRATRQFAFSKSINWNLSF